MYILISWPLVSWSTRWEKKVTRICDVLCSLVPNRPIWSALVFRVLLCGEAVLKSLGGGEIFDRDADCEEELRKLEFVFKRIEQFTKWIFFIPSRWCYGPLVLWLFHQFVMSCALQFQ